MLACGKLYWTGQVDALDRCREGRRTGKNKCYKIGVCPGYNPKRDKVFDDIRDNIGKSPSV